MTILSAQTLSKNARSFEYDRSAVNIGIVHFGIGNFHRAHQAVYVDDLLSTGETQWGITGVSLRSPTMRDTLKPQDYLYTLAILGSSTEYRIIGAIKNVLAAPSEPWAVIDLIATPTTQLISSTITEKGYGLASGEVDFSRADLHAEAASLENPTTIYGFLARGIMQRAQNEQSSKLTIMCCDNISKGGELLKSGVEHLLNIHDPKALSWAEQNVSFISSMVDRVSPATDDALKDAVLRDTKHKDNAPVSAEPFTQWIIEDNFAGARPNFDKVGAVFVNDIEPFERMKLRYLNAAHTMASTLGYLSGDTYVHEALERPEVLKFMRDALYKSVLPNAAVPRGYDGSVYIEDVIKRFQNGNLPYANLQVGTDSSQKIQQRWFPTIDLALANGTDCSYFEFCLGAWVVFIQNALENNVLNDPKKTMFQSVRTDDLNQLIQAYLKITNAGQFKFFKSSNFMNAVNQHAQAIKTKGIKQAIIDF